MVFENRRRSQWRNWTISLGFESRSRTALREITLIIVCPPLSSLRQSQIGRIYGIETDIVLANTIGWVREGDAEHDGCAVVICNGTEEGKKRMQVRQSFTLVFPLF